MTLNIKLLLVQSALKEFEKNHKKCNLLLTNLLQLIHLSLRINKKVKVKIKKN